MYNSLLYQNKEQKQRIIDRSATQLFSCDNKDKEVRYHYIGNKLFKTNPKFISTQQIPSYFNDLNLNIVLDRILLDETDNELYQLFYQLSPDKSLIEYRQNISKDFETYEIYHLFLEFHNSIKQVFRLSEYLTQANHPVQKNKYQLDVIVLYYNCICRLRDGLKEFARCDGLLKMAEALNEFSHNTEFVENSQNAIRIKESIEDIYYTLLISKNKIEIVFQKHFRNFNRELQEAFHQTDFNAKSDNIFTQSYLSALERKIVDIIEKRYHSLFEECAAFTSKHIDFIDPFIMNLYKETKYYLSCINYINILKSKGFNLTYPEITNDHRIEVIGLYDVSLAFKSNRDSDVTVNDFLLDHGEAGAWITGANQGGKTTFARSIGQIMYFSLIGFPVPASYARLPMFSGIFTHFSTEENSFTSNGKLKEELYHIKDIFHSDNLNNSFIILNELFSSATSLDAYDMGIDLINRFIKTESVVICVTHIPQLAMDCTNMISLGTEIINNQLHERTYRIVRKTPEVTAYANDIAQKYNLSYDMIKERLNNET